MRTHNLSRRALSGLILSGMLFLCGVGEIFAIDAEKTNRELSIGLVTDAQYCNCETQGVRHYRESVRKMEECIKSMNMQRPDFVLHIGDFIDRDFASFEVMLPIFQGLQMPGYHVLGNHDFSVAAEKKSEVIPTLGLHALGTGKGYYDISNNNWRFIILNGNDISAIAHPEGSVNHTKALSMAEALKKRNAPNAYDWNGGVGEEQIGWLKETLTQARRSDQKVILFCHFPVFPPNAHNLYNDDQILEIIDSFPNVAAYINGHNHAGNYSFRDGVHYLTLKGMVDTKDNSFAIIELYKDLIRVKGFGREINRELVIVERGDE